MLRMCVYMHSRFIENHSIRILEDGPLISEVVLSHSRCGRLGRCHRGSHWDCLTDVVSPPVALSLSLSHRKRHHRKWGEGRQIDARFMSSQGFCSTLRRWVSLISNGQLRLHRSGLSRPVGRRPMWGRDAFRWVWARCGLLR
jgi:hypothetical protein